MKRITLVFSMLIFAGVLKMSAQSTLYSENFSSAAPPAFPAGWSQYNYSGLTPSTTFWNASDGFNASTVWVTFNNGSNVFALTAAYFTTFPAQANNWLISPKIGVIPANAFIQWDAESIQSGYEDTYVVRVCTDTVNYTDTSKYTTTIAAVASESSAGMVTHYVSLAAFAGQKIHVAIVDVSNGGVGLILDNVKVTVPSSTDLALSTISPTSTDPASFGLGGTQETISGTVTNDGYNVVTNYVVKYQQGTNAPVSQAFTDNLAYGSVGSFTMSVPYVLPSTVAGYPVKVWVELAGDVNHANDTMKTQFTTASFIPTKHLTFEEGTGAWCGWCVRGIVFMDSTRTLYGNSANAPALIAVHDAQNGTDPMAVSAYDSYVAGKIGGFPSVLVDRREVVDPSQLLDVYSNEQGYFGFADISLTNITNTATKYTLTANVKPAVNLSGDYRLVLVLTEDAVHSTSSTYDQHNYYSSASQNQPLTGQGVNYQILPNPIPAAQMYYQFVARSITPSVTGTAGGLPTTMNAGTTYSQTLSATLSASWQHWLMNAHVLLLRASDGQVLNSQNAKVAAGTQNIEAGVSELSLFPNPSANESYLKVSLTKTSSASVVITDITGNVVYTKETGSLSPDTYYYTIPTSDLSNGLYLVSFRTDNGVMTQKLVVAH